MAHIGSPTAAGRSAGTTGSDLEAALGLYGPAIDAGLRESLLVCARREASNTPSALRGLERHIQFLQRSQTADEGSLLASIEIKPDALIPLNQARLRLRADMECKPRRPNRPPEVEPAAHDLISFVQETLRSLKEEGNSYVPQVLGLQLTAIQKLAFAAMYRSRVEHGDARRLLLQVTRNHPLAVCKRCHAVFPDNAKLHGPLASLCERCRKA